MSLKIKEQKVILAYPKRNKMWYRLMSPCEICGWIVEVAMDTSVDTGEKLTEVNRSKKLSYSWFIFPHPRIFFFLIFVKLPSI